jgi:hypothetical protein
MTMVRTITPICIDLQFSKEIQKPFLNAKRSQKSRESREKFINTFLYFSRLSRDFWLRFAFKVFFFVNPHCQLQQNN